MLPDEPSRELRAIVRYGRVDPHALTKRIASDRARSMEWINSLFRTHDKNLTPDQVREREAAHHGRDAARDELETAIEDVARLSAIDGAVLCGRSSQSMAQDACFLPSHWRRNVSVARSTSLAIKRNSTQTATALDIAQRLASRLRIPDQWRSSFQRTAP